jgi:serine/threonine-protein kinase
LLRAGLDDDACGDALATTAEVAGPESILESLAATIGSVPRVLLRDTGGASGVDQVVRPASAEMPAPGGRPARLQVFGELARGGMGAVLKGRDVDLGRDLAVKVLLESHRENPDLVRRFVEEAQIGGQLQHPGVVPVYELGRFGDGRPYFSMKLVKGQTLAAVLAGRGDPADDRARLLSIFLQVAQTVAYAHARGVIHRDLKPSNVMVGAFGEVQVMDWGLAKVLPRGGAADDATAGKSDVAETVIATARSGSDADLSQAGSVMGTPSYMAPEQARGEVEAVDERADVFALGSMLCEILTGRPAFTGRSSGEIHRKAAAADLADAHARLEASRADADLIALASDCLARERDDRPRDASALAGRLGGYLASLEHRMRSAELARAAESARAEEAQARIAVERSRRRRTQALAASLVAMLTLGGLALAYVQQQRQARRARLDRLLAEASAALDRAENAGDPDAPADLEKARVALGQAGEVSAGGIEPAAEARLASLADRAEGVDRLRTLLTRLETIRGDRADHFDAKRADREYAEAFRDFGLDLDAADPREAAGRLAGRPATVEIAAALDEWCKIRRLDLGGAPDGPSWRRLAEVARLADPDEWRNALRALYGTPLAESAAVLEARAADTAALDRQPVASLLLLAGMLEQAGRRVAAVEVLRAAWRRAPGDFWVNYSLGNSSWEQGEFRFKRPYEALRFFTAAVATRPHSSAARNGLGWALHVQNDLDQAIVEYREAIRLRPDDHGPHYNLGSALGALKKHAEAADAYREAIRIVPDGPGAYANLGINLAALGRLEEAADAYRTALRLRPEDSGILHSLGHVLSTLGRHAEAADAFREAARLQADNAEHQIDLGRSLKALGKPREAAEAYREAVRLRPDDAELRNNLGTLLCDVLHDYGPALAEFREAARLKPDFAPARHNAGVALLRQGKPDEAIPEFREAIRLDPGYVEARLGLGGALWDRDQGVEALASVREAIRLRPDHAKAHRNLGLLLSGRGEWDAAVAAYREAIRLEPGHASSHDNLGLALLRQRKTDEAIAAYREAIRIDPNAPQRYLNLGVALLKKGDYAEARAALGLARDKAPDQADGPRLVERVERQLAEAEHRERLAPGLDAALRGEALPAHAEDGRCLARIASDRGWHAGAARLWSAAFDSDPAGADDLAAAHRYNAACSAALAGAGRSLDEPSPDEAARARLRAQALDWLRADLALRAKQVDSDAEARQKLRYWLADPDLAGVRDAEPLARLPEEERAAWQGLWSEVKALVAESHTGSP